MSKQVTHGISVLHLIVHLTPAGVLENDCLFCDVAGSW